jgi:hypothetical protein
MANVTKTTDISLLAWQEVATANVAVGADVSVSNKFAATVVVHLGRKSGTSFTERWPTLRIEVSSKASGNDAWSPAAMFTMSVGSNIASTTLNGAVSAGATTCTVTAATNIAAGDLLFLGHTTTVANYELVRVKSVSGTTITFEEACTSAHDNGAVVTDQGETYVAQLDLMSVTRVRAVLDNAGGGVTVACRAMMVTGDSIG